MAPSDPNFGKRKITGIISAAKSDARGFPEGPGTVFQFVNGNHAESNELSAPGYAPEADTWPGGKNVSDLVWRDDVVKQMVPGAKADAMPWNSSSEADEACPGDAAPGGAHRRVERFGENIRVETFCRIE